MASHLTSAERDRIAQLYHQQADRKEIARSLGRHPSTIGRELRRNGAGHEYYAVQAQRQAERRRRQRPLERKMYCIRDRQAVRERLAGEWGAQQIAGRMKEQDCDRRVSHQTIYAWIKQDPDRQHWESLLRRRGKRTQAENTAPTPDAARIRNRPEVIEQRLRLGDFEGDTVLGAARHKAAWRRWSAASRG